MRSAPSVWLPSDLWQECSAEAVARVQAGKPTPAELRQWARVLRAARVRWLLPMRTPQLVEALDETSRLWLQPHLPERHEAIALIHQHTGFSSEMVAHCIELEMKSSLRPDLEAALRRELGGLACLDDFQEDTLLGGSSRALGVPLVGAIFSSNIPALPHLSVMRALLVKSALLGRSSRAEPFFLPLYLQTLARVSPELARCVTALTWDPDDIALTSTFLSELDHLIAYGGTAAFTSLRCMLPPTLPTSWHGHKLGFVLLLRGALVSPSARRRLADALAYDFSLFEQQACLSPQFLWVEDAKAEELQSFTEMLIQALGVWKERLPPRRLPVEVLGHRRQMLELLQLRQALGEPVQVLTPASELQGVVVQLSSELLVANPLERFISLVPISNFSEVLPLLEQRRGQLQNVALEGDSTRYREVCNVLASLGVSRICPPGKMGVPSMMWRHDGGMRLAELVRWCDEERLSPEERLLTQPLDMPLQGDDDVRDIL